MLNYFLNDDKAMLTKKEKKKKLHELLDKYESVEGIEKNAIILILFQTRKYLELLLIHVCLLEPK